ncbi:PAS domain-containing sensor histidine kinase [Ferrovibrio sp.]|uniref:PAS domain-containing sensor histidine kinase n=1 Tax=Ferrovibrio sp. TaxID=1917215 RepID=UPI00261FF866|nr:PAS domain-containing sensor histidine kinase [Ferrovibrio sp.]
MLQSSFPSLTSLPPAADDPRLFAWSGEFRDRRVEQMYRQSRLVPMRSMLQTCGLAATSVFCLLLVRDYIVHGYGQTFLFFALVRGLGLFVGILFQYLLRRLNDVQMLDIVAGIGMASLSTLTFMTWIISAPPALNAGSLIFAYLLVYYLLVPCSARLTLANVVYVTAGTAILTAVWLPFRPENVYSLLLFVLIGNGLGFVGMRQIKLERRRNFMAHEEARRVTEALTLARQESRRRNEYQAWALDALPVGVMLFHPDGTIHTINRRAAELLALPPGLLNPGDSHEALLRFLSQRRDFGDTEISDMRYHIDRLMRGAAGAAAARHMPTGKVLEFTVGRLPDNSVAVTIFDATERYALNRRLRHAVEVAGDGFVIYDVQDRIAICSSRFAALYGLTSDQAVGMSFDELVERGYDRGVFSRDEKDQGAAAAATVSRRRIPERMIEIRTNAGEWFLVHERVTPSGDLVVVRTNITARRRMEDELRRAKEDAERALADLRGAQASLILAEKMASLGSLVAGMSHEISTPLGISVSAASHMAEEVEQLTIRFRDDQLRRSDLEGFLDTATEATRIMQGNLARAARLIQAFKQVAADQSTDDLRLFDIGEYLREIMLSLAPALRRSLHDVRIDCPDKLVIRSRPGALGQIVTNLVMNALQHAFEGGGRPGVISINVTQPREGRIAVEFRDNGRGIVADDLPRVFDPFFTTRRGTGGTGLGLHIVYNLVSQVLGGTIAVSSREGEGTRFTIIFPQDVSA